MSALGNAEVGRPRDRSMAGRPVYLVRRLLKLMFAAGLLAVGALMLSRQLLVSVSSHAAINARVVVIRAPIGGFVNSVVAKPGTALPAGTVLGYIDDPLADRSRLDELDQRLSEARLRREALAAQISQLQEARAKSEAKASAYQRGRVSVDQMRVSEAQAQLSAALSHAADSAAAARRDAALRAQGFQSPAVAEHRHAQAEADSATALAARRRLAARVVDLTAAREGVFLGASYNDAPYSLQEARRLALQIAEARIKLTSARRSVAQLKSLRKAARKRLLVRSRAVLRVPVTGQLWVAQAFSREYVSKGQDLYSVVDCSSAVVTASASRGDYNELWLGEPVRFRVAGTTRRYSGRIINLGASGSKGVYAIAPPRGDREVIVGLSGLAQDPRDGCAVGRSGEVRFERPYHSLGADFVGMLHRLFTI